jgi:proteasome beta subunit
VCQDGLVLAADRRATSGNIVVDKRAKKIHKVTDNMAITTAGGVSDIQLLLKLIKAEIKLKSLRTKREPNVTETANLLAGMIYSNIRKMSLIPGISHFVLGGRDKSGYHLYDLFADGSLTDVEDYIASGSGSVFAYGVLEALYNKELSTKQGIELATKAINAALQRDTATGEGIEVLTITKEGVQKAVEKKVEAKL